MKVKMIWKMMNKKIQNNNRIFKIFKQTNKLTTKFLWEIIKSNFLTLLGLTKINELKKQKKKLYRREKENLEYKMSKSMSHNKWLNEIIFKIFKITNLMEIWDNKIV